MSETDAFAAYRNRATPDTLVALLRAHQGRIFRLCYQVLHNAHDAEDAAQGVLMRIPAEIRQFADTDAFRRWLYRVSLNAALETARKAVRRKAHESRAAMEKPEPRPLDDATRLSLFEAIASLDDASRDLILEHHFEGETLETLGRREGVSAPAIHKRLDSAHDSLRRRLSAALAALPIEAMFVRAPSTPDLVTGTVLAKAAVVGGTIMTAKASIGATVAIAVGCLVAGSGAGAWVASRSGKHEVENLKRQLAANQAVAPIPSTVVLASSPTTSPKQGSPKGVTEEVAAVSLLQAKLKRFKEWMEHYKAEYDTIPSDQANAYRARKMAEMGELLIGLRELVFSNPGEFMTFAGNPENEWVLRTLLLKGLGIQLNDSTYIPQQFSQMPRELNDRLMDLLRTGTTRQRMALLDYFANVFGQPAEYQAVYPTLLSEPDEDLQRLAVQAIWRTGSWTDEAFAAVTHLGKTTANSDTKSSIANSMMWVQRPEAVTYLVERLQATTDYHEAISAAQTLQIRVGNDRSAARKPASPELEDRVAQAVAQGLTRGFDGATFLVVLRAGLWLPLGKLKPLLQQAGGLAPTDHARKTVAKLVEMAHQSATADELLKASWE